MGRQKVFFPRLKNTPSGVTLRTLEWHRRPLLVKCSAFFPPGRIRAGQDRRSTGGTATGRGSLGASHPRILMMFDGRPTVETTSSRLRGRKTRIDMTTRVAMPIIKRVRIQLISHQLSLLAHYVPAEPDFHRITNNSKEL